MVTLTYLVLVVAVLVVAWVAVRRPFGGRSDGRLHPRLAGEQLRRFVVGSSGPSADLVDRMAVCLVHATTIFGSSYAIPSYLAATLPRGVFEAASTVKPQLTDEVLTRYGALMAERARRMGRADTAVAFPHNYRLRLVLACGATEEMIASFDPVVDVAAALAAVGGRTVPAGLPSASTTVPREKTTRRHSEDGGDLSTTRRPGATGSDASTVVLEVDGRPHARCRLGGQTTVVTVGRGSVADLSSPDEVTDVSRAHAELTLAQGAVYAEDKGSANGTWIQRSDDLPERLGRGEPVLLGPGDRLWLDEDGRVTVSCS